MMLDFEADFTYQIDLERLEEARLEAESELTSA